MDNFGRNALFILIIQLIIPIAYMQINTSQIIIPSQPNSVFINQGQTYNYFNSVFIISKKLFTITLQPLQKHTVTVFLSAKDTRSNLAVNEYPNQSDYAHKCESSELNTCIIELDKLIGQKLPSEVAIYFSVYSDVYVAYNLFAEEIDQTFVDLGMGIQTIFTNIHAADILIINRMEQSQQITAIFTYQSIGSFNAIGTFSKIPNSQQNMEKVISVSSAGAYKKIMKIPPKMQNSYVYILISSAKDTSVSLQFQRGSPQLLINSTLIDHTQTEIKYIYQSKYQDTEKSLNILMSSFAGFGIFYVNYCDGIFQWSDGNKNGIIHQIIIKSQQRQNCLKKKYLQKQKLTIQVKKVYSFTFEIQFYQKLQQELIEVNRNLVSHIKSKEGKKNYPLKIQSFPTSYIISFKFLNLDMQLSLQLQQCNILNKQCTYTQVPLKSGKARFIFNSKQNSYYGLIIINLSMLTENDILAYSILLQLQQPIVKQVKDDLIYRQTIGLRQYQYYLIDFLKLDQAIIDFAQVKIRINTINGNIYLLSSLLVQKPTIEQFFRNNNRIKFELKQTITYYVNKSNPFIYLSVFGQKQSLFQLSYTIDTNINNALQYLPLKDGSIATFNLNQVRPYRLLSFQPHIKPFSIRIIGSPECIRYGYSLPLSQMCHQTVPSQLLIQKVFFNISNGEIKNAYNFTVNIETAQYELGYNNTIVMGCTIPCFSLISITLSMRSTIIVKGMAQISYAQNQVVGQKNGNILSCLKYPCSIKINTTLTYGGFASIYLEQSQIIYLDYQAIPFSMSKLPIKVISPIKQFNDVNTILAKSDGLTLKTSYFVYSFDYEINNILNIDFTTFSQQNITSSHQSNPLRHTFILPLAQQLINALKCSQGTIYCIIALIFQVDKQVPMSLTYMKKGQGLISSNSNSAIKMPINYPLQFNSSLNIKDFTFSNQFNSTELRLNIEPLSNCHPILYNNFHHQYIYEQMLYQNIDNFNFKILSQQPCIYTVTLSASLYPSIIPNKYYSFQAINDEVIVILLFSFNSWPTFEIFVQAQQKIGTILVNSMHNTYDSIIIPTETSYSYMGEDTNRLMVSEQQFNRVYAIRVITKSAALKLIVENKDSIILNHNENITRSLSVSMKQAFIILSRKNVSVFVRVQGKISVDISFVDGSPPFQTQTLQNGIFELKISNSTVNNSIISYGIAIRNLESSSLKYSIKFNESIQYLPILYQKIIHYDSFKSVNQDNCYTYQSPLQLGRSSLILDLVMNKNKYKDLNQLELSYSISIKDKQQITHKLSKIASPHTYRLEMLFIPGQIYTICLSSRQYSAVNKQYYVLINSPSLQHIIQQQTITKFTPSMLDTYQVIQQGNNSNIMLELTICDPQAPNNKIIIASSIFSDNLFTTHSNLSNYHKNSDSIFAKLSVSQGYHFLGVKNEIGSVISYSIKYKSINDEWLVTDLWDIKNKDMIVDKNSKEVNIYLDSLVVINQYQQQKNITITYVIYLLDLSHGIINNQTQTTIAFQSRCPNKGKKQEPSVKIQGQSNIFSYSMSFTFPALLDYKNNKKIVKFTLQNTPLKFNITAKADIHVNSQSFSLYYNTKYFDLTSPSQKGQESSNIGTIIIILIIVIGIAVAGYIWLKKSKKEETNDLQLTIINQNRLQDKKQGLLTIKSQKGYRQMIDDIK